MSRSNAAAALLFRRKGDGSTLNLGFTTMGGVLDSRFTFSRASNATYINSSGYVAYANSNIAINTAWLDTNTLPTGWLVYNTATPNAVLTIPSSGRRSMTVTSGVQSFLYQALTVPAGVTYTASIIVHSVTGTGPHLGALFAIDNGTISNYYKDGAGISSSTIVTAGTYAITFTGGDQIRLVGAAGSAASTFTIEISSVQIQIGTTISPAFVPNTSTSAAYYAPRFDYDPTTLAAKGLLIEGSATNLTKYSDNAFSNAYWESIASKTTAVDSVVTSPTGVASTASTLTEIAGASVSRHIHQLTGEFTPTVATSYTMSAWVKQPSSAAVRYVQLAFWAAGFGANAFINYDIQAGTVGTGGAAITESSITAHPNGWYRITATAPATATGSSGFQLGFSTTSGAVRTETYTVTAGSEKAIYLWGAQMEAGVGASSYIPTTTAQVTRNPDLALMTSTNFSSWFTGGTTGTFFVDWHGGVRGITSNVRSVISTDDVSTKHLHLQQVSAAGTLKVADFSAAHSVSTANSITSGARTKGAFNFVGSTSTVNLCLNGSTVATSTAIAFSVAPTWLVLGGTSTTGTSLTDLTTVLNGSIRQIKYYPTALTSAQLIAMTA